MKPPSGGRALVASPSRTAARRLRGGARFLTFFASPPLLCARARRLSARARDVHDGDDDIGWLDR